MNAGFRRSFSRFTFSKCPAPLTLRRASPAYFSAFPKFNTCGLSFRRIDK